ncbi:hypothetical protein [Parvularcula lutaonensis]|uniref:Uncharacterized protein n=1 Tax=Parvularcula lutaonensis TaxID=491923 RepID=A0ABV7MB95_9PROT|nr:hypothetical protein [Parvularcula lutaonensis]GGY39816.1 hypothetical protein GCM10007148_05320 [Parvularcula lutaonensis]
MNRPFFDFVFSFQGLATLIFLMVVAEYWAWFLVGFGLLLTVLVAHFFRGGTAPIDPDRKKIKESPNSYWTAEQKRAFWARKEAERRRAMAASAPLDPPR